MHEPVLPRSHWNSEPARRADLDEARARLDLQERLWNSMVAYWRRTSPENAPLPSPPWTAQKSEETITSFP